MNKISKVILSSIIVLVVTSSCRQEEQKKSTAENKTKPPATSVLKKKDCNLVPFQPDSSENKSTFVFKKQVVIKFDRLINAIEKYDNQNGYDTLCKILNDKSRQRLYRIIDQWGYYQSYIKPKLDEYKIPIVRLPENASWIIFEDNSGKYQIDVSKLKDKDGLLMNAGGKPPVFWSEHENEDQCVEDNTLIEWYFNSN